MTGALDGFLSRGNSAVNRTLWVSREARAQLSTPHTYPLFVIVILALFWDGSDTYSALFPPVSDFDAIASFLSRGRIQTTTLIVAAGFTFILLRGRIPRCICDSTRPTVRCSGITFLWRPSGTASARSSTTSAYNTPSTRWVLTTLRVSPLQTQHHLLGAKKYMVVANGTSCFTLFNARHGHLLLAQDIFSSLLKVLRVWPLQMQGTAILCLQNDTWYLVLAPANVLGVSSLQMSNVTRYHLVAKGTF